MPTISFSTAAQAQETARRLVHDDILSLLPAGQPGGLAVLLRQDGQERIFTSGNGVAADSQFNIASLRKPFEATVLAEAALEDKLRLDEPVAKYVPELADGGDIRRVTLGQLATHSSGLLMPQDHPPWPTEHYTLPAFLQTLREWQADEHHQPGGQHMYTHAGYILLQVALERGLHAPVRELLQARMFDPLGLHDSLVPDPSTPPPRAVQGYGEEGDPIGVPGDQQTYYDFPGTGQMYSTLHDLDRFLAANLGEFPTPPALGRALQLARTPVLPIAGHIAQALAWEVDSDGGVVVVDKNGGLNNASAYMGMVPALKLSLVVLSNRGGVDVNSAGRRVLRQLAQQRS